LTASNVELETYVQPTQGLIVKLSDVLFDTGQYSLNPDARENLSKIGRIVLAYPAFEFDVEGYAESVGTGPSDMVLSERRATVEPGSKGLATIRVV